MRYDAVHPHWSKDETQDLVCSLRAMGLLDIYDPGKINQTSVEVAHVVVVPESCITPVQRDSREWAFRSPNNRGGLVAAREHMLSFIMEKHPVLGKMIRRILDVLQDSKIEDTHGDDENAAGGSMRTTYKDGLLTIVVSVKGPGLEAHRDGTQFAQDNTPFMTVDDGNSDPDEYDDEDDYISNCSSVHILTDYTTQYCMPWTRVCFDSTITHKVVRPDAKDGRLTVTALLRTAVLERAARSSKSRT